MSRPVAPGKMGGVGWIKTQVWDETHDAEKSIGWCPAVIDYNGDGKTGAYTTPDQPADPKLDRAIGPAYGYGIAFNPIDGSVWYAGLDNPVPGRIIPHGDRERTLLTHARRKSMNRRLTILNVRAWRRLEL